jgi:GNAT superfamily N-acetyltransferase
MQATSAYASPPPGDVGFSPNYPRILEKNFQSSAHLTGLYGLTARESIALIVPTFLELVTEVGPRDWDNFHAYLNQPPLGGTLKALQHLGQLMECSVRLGADRHLLILRACLIRLESERPEFLIKARCQALLAPEPAKTVLGDQLESDQLSRRLDLRAPGRALWLCKDAVGTLDQHGALSAVVTTDKSRQEVESAGPAPIDPREIDDAIFWLEWGYAGMSGGIPVNFIHSLDSRVIQPLTSGDETRGKALLSRLFPELPEAQRDALSGYLEATRHTLSVPPGFLPPDQHDLVARREERLMRQRAAELQPIWTIGDREDPAEMRPDIGEATCAIDDLAITLPLQHLPDRLRALAHEIRSAMCPVPRSPVDTDRIPWTPRFWAAPEKHDKDLADLLGSLPFVLPSIEEALGLPRADLKFRSLCHLAAAFGAAEPEEWRYIGEVLQRHPLFMPILFEVVCLFAQNHSDLVLLDHLTARFSLNEIDAILRPYRQLLSTTENEVLRCPIRSLLLGHRDVARRQVGFGLVNANRSLRKLLEAVANDCSIEATVPRASDLLHGRVLRVAAHELTAETIRRARELAETLPCAHKFHPLDQHRSTLSRRDVPGHLLTNDQLELISAFATLGLLEYPPEVAFWLRQEFQDEFAQIMSGTMHFLMAENEVVALMHVVPEGKDTVYGSRFYAHPEARSARLAFPFLAEVIEHYVNQGLTFELWMWEEHGARGDYGDLGLESVPELRRDDFYPGVQIGFDRLRVTPHQWKAAAYRRRMVFE